MSVRDELAVKRRELDRLERELAAAPAPPMKLTIRWKIDAVERDIARLESNA